MRINFHKKEQEDLIPRRPSTLSFKLSTMEVVEEEDGDGKEIGGRGGGRILKAKMGRK